MYRVFGSLVIEDKKKRAVNETAGQEPVESESQRKICPFVKILSHLSSKYVTRIEQFTHH